LEGSNEDTLKWQDTDSTNNRTGLALLGQTNWVPRPKVNSRSKTLMKKLHAQQQETTRRTPAAGRTRPATRNEIGKQETEIGKQETEICKQETKICKPKTEICKQETEISKHETKISAPKMKYLVTESKNLAVTHGARFNQRR
jgi:hypothetical protein